MTHAYTIYKSHIAFAAFLLIFFFDALLYSNSGYFGFSLPVGFVGVVLSFLLIPFYILQKGVGASIRLFFLLLLPLPIILIFLTGHGELADLYFWCRALAIFIMGYYSMNILLHVDVAKRKNIYVYLLLFSCIIFIFIKGTGENYLRISDGLTIFSFYIISLVKSRMAFFVLSTITAVALFYIGSRFGLLAYMLSVLLLFYVRLNFRSQIFLLVLSIPALFSVYYFLLYQYSLVTNIHNNRLLRLIFERENDTSLQVRNTLLNDAIEVFENNILLGEYKYYLNNGSGGGYSHNFFSFWAELGILGVFISLSLFILIFNTLYISYKKIGIAPQYYSFPFLVTSLALMGFLFSKGYVWSLLYFSCGLSLSFLLIDKNK